MSVKKWLKKYTDIFQYIKWVKSLTDILIITYTTGQGQINSAVKNTMAVIGKVSHFYSLYSIKHLSKKKKGLTGLVFSFSKSVSVSNVLWYK